MSCRIELRENSDLTKMGHIFCGDCATELNVILIGDKVYLNPQYVVEWDLAWHEFHNVKFIFPHLTETIWDRDFEAQCPCCGNKDVNLLRPQDNSLFDIKLIKRSLGASNHYVCLHCEGSFASRECVIRTGNKYICGDCAAHAMR